jgi:RNase P/RNase MRP subunit POP5
MATLRIYERGRALATADKNLILVLLERDLRRAIVKCRRENT